MTIRKNFNRIVVGTALGTLAVTLAGPLSAQTQTQANQADVVVTATRLPTSISDVGSSVTVIDGDEIRRRQFRTVSDILSTVPGIGVVQLGPRGQQTSVFARGANSNQTLVLIDGIEAGDPSSANGAFNFADLSATHIERIEVVRGAQSTLYGSDAIGGVINIITRRGTAKREFDARIEAGEHGLVSPAITGSGKIGRVALSGAMSWFKTEGETVTATRVRGNNDNEADGHENFTASLRADTALSDTIDLKWTGRFVRTDTDTDVTAEDPDSQQISHQAFSRLAATGHFFEDFWEPTFALSLTRYRFKSSNDPDAVSTSFQRTENTGIKRKVELQNNFHLSNTNILTLGLEAESEEMQQNTRLLISAFGFAQQGATDVNVDSRAVYLQDRFEFFDQFSGTVGIRYDDHQSFGGKATWRATPLYRIKSTGTRLKASYGTGYRAPALFELFGQTASNFGTFNGNPNLQPEESRGYEAGFDQELLDGRVSFGAVYFASKIKNLIVSTATTVNNTGSARTKGVEAFISLKPVRGVTVDANYTYTRAEDEDTNADLLRRPKHKANFALGWQASQALFLSLDWTLVDHQRDVSFTTGARNITTPGYGLVGIAGSWAFNDQAAVYVRARNLLGRDYEVADGFRGTGRIAVIGVRSRF